MNSHVIASSKISELKRLNSDIERIENNITFFGYVDNQTKLKLEELKKELRILIKTL